MNLQGYLKISIIKEYGKILKIIFIEVLNDDSI